jgi:hypothetical protein
MDNLARVPGECPEESAVAVHDDEAKARIRLEQLGQSFGVELVVTEI